MPAWWAASRRPDLFGGETLWVGASSSGDALVMDMDGGRPPAFGGIRE